MIGVDGKKKREFRERQFQNSRMPGTGLDDMYPGYRHLNLLSDGVSVGRRS